MSRWMNGWMVDEWMNKCMDECTHLDGWMDRKKGRVMDAWEMDVWMGDEWIDGWICGWGMNRRKIDE